MILSPPVLDTTPLSPPVLYTHPTLAAGTLYTPHTRRRYYTHPTPVHPRYDLMDVAASVLHLQEATAVTVRRRCPTDPHVNEPNPDWTAMEKLSRRFSASLTSPSSKTALDRIEADARQTINTGLGVQLALGQEIEHDQFQSGEGCQKVGCLVLGP